MGSREVAISYQETTRELNASLTTTWRSAIDSASCTRCLLVFANFRRNLQMQAVRLLKHDNMHQPNSRRRPASP